jgi:hypothetical protein
MTPERYQRVAQIFQAASDRGPEARPAFLASACAGDDDLRREVEAMLAADAQSGGFLEKPADDLAAHLLDDPTRTRLTAGAQLGPYRIEGALGSGGMGEVFRARDTRLHRTVAIKILPRDKTADPERKRRFMQEARAVSALNHPNIVTLTVLRRQDRQLRIGQWPRLTIPIASRGDHIYACWPSVPHRPRNDISCTAPNYDSLFLNSLG